MIETLWSASRIQNNLVYTHTCACTHAHKHTHTCTCMDTHMFSLKVCVGRTRGQQAQHFCFMLTRGETSQNVLLVFFKEHRNVPKLHHSTALCLSAGETAHYREPKRNTVWESLVFISGNLSFLGYVFNLFLSLIPNSLYPCS